MTDEQPDESREASSLLARLVAECLERVAAEGTGAVDAFCREHAEHEDAIRRRIEALHEMGLLDPAARSSEQREFPEELGPFRLIRRIGSGGMGVVVLAEQRPLGRTVALKLMRPDQVFFQGSRERFQREVLAVARLHHPGIVAVHTAGEEGGIPFFAMEYVHGCSLADALNALRTREPSALSARALLRAAAGGASQDGVGAAEPVELDGKTWAEVCLRLMLQVAEALAHAHQNGIHHRDIKPSNIMVTPTGRAMLLDFGLASASGTSRMTQSGSHLGSLPYMAPESLEGGQPEDGAAADVYSLGVTLYELLTLHCPFLDGNPSVMIRKVLQGEPDPIKLRYPDVSWAAAIVCGKAMDRDPARRYRSAEELAQDLRNALENRPILARRPGPVLRVRRWSQRHPARAVALVASVLLVGASVTYGFLQRSTNRALTKAGETKDQLLADLEKRNAELDAALVEVDESFGRVVDAGVRMLTRVGFDVLQNVPMSDSVSRDLLQEAEDLALELERDAPDDPRLRFEMARTLRLLAQFEGNMGDFETGDTQLRRAVVLLEGLVAERPAEEDALEQLVRTYHVLGTSLLQRGELEDAEDACRSGADAGLEGLAGLESAGAPELTLAKFRSVTAMNLQVLGAALNFQERQEEADAPFREARALLAASTEVFQMEQLESFAACSVNHGNLLVALGKMEEAQDALREGIGVFRDMLEREPGNARNRLNLGRSLQFLATILPDGDPDAVTLATEAVEELRVARRDGPGLGEMAHALAKALATLGSELLQQERPEEARTAQEEAIQVIRSMPATVGATDQLLVLAQIRLGECLTEVGDLLAAEDMYRAAVDTSSPWIDDPSADLPRRSHTVVVLESFSRFLFEQGMAEDAAPHSHRALEESRRQIETRPGDPRMVAQLSTTAILTVRIELELANHGAGREILESIRDAALNDEELVEAAGLAARCLTAAGEDAAQAARDVALALSFLGRVQDQALLEPEGPLAGEEFAALRARDEYGEWRSEL